jgi:hypothetical protein
MLPVGVTKLFAKYQSLMVRPKGPSNVIMNTAHSFRDQTRNLNREFPFAVRY